MNESHSLSHLWTENFVRLRSTLRVLLVCCAFSGYAAALPIQQAAEKPGPPSKTETQSEHHHSTAFPSPGEAVGAQTVKSYIKITIPDLEVTDQSGKRMRFYTDLVKGKVVVINFIYTTCTYVCPMQGTSFSKLQAALGDRFGKDVYLISVSTDPVTDTPEKLRTWAQKFGPKKGWELVTGEKTQMDELLLALTGDSARKGEHSAIAIIGNDDKGLWVRAYGLEGPQRMVQIIDRIVTQPAGD